jgi:RNA recognition motif-containing protein
MQPQGQHMTFTGAFQNTFSANPANTAVQSFASASSSGPDNPDNIFVGAIPFHVPELEFLRIFSRFGEIENGRLAVDPHTHRGKGYGFVKVQSLHS